jgi:sialidase-1
MELKFRPIATFRVRVLFAIFALTFVSVSCADEAKKKVTVFKAGEAGIHTFRIPVLVRAHNGDLLALAESRKKSAADYGDIDIVLKRSRDNGRTWGRLELAQDEFEDPNARVWIGNPTPIVDQTDPAHPGRIWLVFTRNNAQMFVASSDDDGKTWSERREITQSAGKPVWDWYAAGPVHGIQLERGPHAGRLIAPCDHQIKSTKSWGSHIVYSDDHGVTWRLGASDTRAGDDPLHPNECVAVELIDGRVYVNAREHNGSDPATRAVAYSSDGGATFDSPFVAERHITSPVVQNSTIRFAATDRGDKRNVLIHCGPGDPKQRRDLTMLLSFDEGKTWEHRAVIQSGPAAYCDLVKLNNNEIGVLYEAGKQLYDEIVFEAENVNSLFHAK